MNENGINARKTFIFLLVINIIAFVSIVCYFLQFWDILKIFQYVGFSFLISIAAFFCGGIIGFLFGIPKIIQNEDIIENSRNSSSKIIVLANSNLGQISNWITNLIIGLGLIQLTKLPGMLRKVSIILSEAFFNGSFESFLIVINSSVFN